MISCILAKQKLFTVIGPMNQKVSLFYKLPTNSARRCEWILLISNDCYGFEFQVANTYRFACGSSFGTNWRAVGCIFDITATNDWAIRNANCCPNLKFAVWTILNPYNSGHRYKFDFGNTFGHIGWNQFYRDQGLVQLHEQIRKMMSN